MVLDAILLNTQHYKLWIKGKVEQSRKRSSTHPYTSVLKLLKRKPLGHPNYSPQLYFIIKKLSILNFNSYINKSYYASIILNDLEVTFLEEREDAAF